MSWPLCSTRIKKGIIHRDLKPSNILVSPHESKPLVKVIDFGVAKALSVELTSRTLFTGFGQMIGTPQYMSPEQAEINALDVDTRSDIYSLGVVLYELLTGRTPLDPQVLRAAGYAEIQRLIREEEPSRPSTRVSTLGGALPEIAKRHGTEAEKFVRMLRGDLDWIVMKALDKDRSRRYATANGFATDIRRHLADEPVLASPPSHAYRLGKLIRRNKGKVAALTAIALSVVTGVWGIVLNWLAAEDARGKSETQTGIARNEWKRAEDNVYTAHMLLAKNRFEDGRLGGFRQLLERHRPAAGKPDLRGWEWYYLNSLLHREAQKMQSGGGAVRSIDWHPGGVILASASDAGMVEVWDARTGVLKQQFAGHRGPVHQVQWNPGGTRLASCGEDGTVRLWEMGGAKPVLTYTEASGPVRALAWTKDGASLISGGDDEQLRLWSAGDGHTIVRGSIRGPVVSLAFHPNEPSFVCATGKSQRWRYYLIGIRDGRFIEEYSGERELIGVSWKPDGSGFATGQIAVQGRIFNMRKDGTLEDAFISHKGPVRGVDCALDSRTIVSCSDDQSVQCWDLPRKQSVRFIAGHSGAVLAAKWSPTNDLIASAGADGTIRTWEVKGERFPNLLRRTKHTVTGVAWNPDSSGIAVVGNASPSVTILDGRNAEVVKTFESSASYLWDTAWSEDGTKIAAVGGAGDVTLWDVSTGAVLGTSSVGWIGTEVRWSRDNRHLLVVHRPHWGIFDETCSVTVFDGGTCEKISTFKTPRAERACWSPDGREVLTCDWDGRVIRWDWKKGAAIRTIIEAPARLSNIEWNHSGSRLAVTTSTGGLIVADAAGNVLYRTEGQTSDVQGLAWSPDGRRIATTASEGTLRVSNADNGEELLLLQTDGRDTYCVSWSPDGRKIATGSLEASVRIWDATKGLTDINSEQIPNDTRLHYENAIIHRPPALTGGDDKSAGPIEVLAPEIPERSKEARPAQIDLTAFYTSRLDKDWHAKGDAAGNNLTYFPGGLTDFEGIRFDARGLIQLKGKVFPDFPKEITGIKIGLHAKKMHFLMGTLSKDAEDAVIAKHRVHYADGQTKTVDVIYGQHVRDWGVRPDSTEPDTPVPAWKGPVPRHEKKPGYFRRIYHQAWENPIPNIEISSIDLVSEYTLCGPFVLAITVE